MGVDLHGLAACYKIAQHHPLWLCASLCLSSLISPALLCSPLGMHFR